MNIAHYEVYYCDVDPAHEFDTFEAADKWLREAVANEADIEPAEVVTESCSLDTTYYYASQAERDADEDGAYIPRVRAVTCQEDSIVHPERYVR